jgi:phage antirepressor YoqD-like protein
MKVCQISTRSKTTGKYSMKVSKQTTVEAEEQFQHKRIKIDYEDELSNAEGLIKFFEQLEPFVNVDETETPQFFGGKSYNHLEKLSNNEDNQFDFDDYIDINEEACEIKSED